VCPRLRRIPLRFGQRAIRGIQVLDKRRDEMPSLRITGKRYLKFTPAAIVNLATNLCQTTHQTGLLQHRGWEHRKVDALRELRRCELACCFAIDGEPVATICQILYL
jgi:hypothetical protein